MGLSTYLQITKGHKTKIDNEDLARLKEAGLLRWSAQVVGKSIYASRNVGTRKLYLHRWILNAPTGMLVDHIDGNPLNNTKANLRLAYHRDNARNQRGKENRQSEFKGVSKAKENKSWFAQIEFNGIHITLGTFGCPEDAAKAYDIANVILFGDFCSPNYQVSRKFLKLRQSLIEEASKKH